jgi:hypothetical protein
MKGAILMLHPIPIERISFRRLCHELHTIAVLLLLAVTLEQKPVKRLPVTLYTRAFYH